MGVYIGTNSIFVPESPYCWYEFNWDYKDKTWNFGAASWTSTFATLDSWQQVLQTDWTNVVLLPSEVTSSAITTYTIAFWMKTLTTSPTYWYYLWCGSAWSNPSMSFYESTSWRNYYEWTNSSSASKNNRDITISWMTTWWRMVTLRSNWTGRSAVVFTINGTNTATTAGTSWSDSSSIFWWSKQLAIWARRPNPTTDTWLRTSIQISNFVISHSYWSDTELQNFYDETKTLYWL